MALEEVDPQQVVAEVEYLASKDLTDVANVTESLRTLVADLNSSNWLAVCQGLTTARQLTKFHRSELVPMVSLLVAAVLKALNNPRSAVLKSCLMATADFFQAFGPEMLPSLDPLLLQLLLKASQDKKFVAGEADAALSAMTAFVPPVPLIRKLQPYAVHKSPKVRAKAAVALHLTAARLGSEGIRDFGLPTLLKLAGSQVGDHLPEAREAAKKLTLQLHSAFLELRAQQQQQEAALNEGRDAVPAADLAEGEPRKEANPLATGGPPGEEKSVPGAAARTDAVPQDPERRPLKAGPGGRGGTEGTWEQLCQSQLSVTAAKSILRITA